MPTTAAFAETAALIGEPARASMLAALMDGRALTAGELAGAAGITPQTASVHLARLVQAGLLALERQGRHRYHRLASAEVAAMLEGLMTFAAGMPRHTPRVGPRDAAMRRARTCYNHLAGEIAVAMADRMQARGELEFSADGGVLTEAGTSFLHRLGVTLEPPAGRARVFCRPCLDWSERRPHIAGTVGAALCRTCLERDWFLPVAGSRALILTPAGQRTLATEFALAHQDG